MITDVEEIGVKKEWKEEQRSKTKLNKGYTSVSSEKVGRAKVMLIIIEK
jgi:hypothetical protein